MAEENSQLQAIGQFLIERAQLGPQDGPIIYRDLARQFGYSPPGKNWSAHPFCQIFAALDQEDTDCQRPFRTVLVVSQSKGMPGPGFFKTVKQFRNISVPYEEDARREFFRQELECLYQYWRTRSEGV